MVPRRLLSIFVCLRCQLRLPTSRSQGLVRSTPSLRLRNFASSAREASKEDTESSKPGDRQDDRISDDELGAAKFGNVAESSQRQRGEEAWPQVMDTDHPPLIRRMRPTGFGSQDVADLRSSMLSEIAYEDEPRRKRVFRSRGQKLEVNERALPQRVLGKRAKTIVLRDVGKWEKRGQVEEVLIQPADGERNAGEDLDQILGQGNLQENEHNQQVQKESGPPVDLEQILDTEAGKPSLEEALLNIHELRPRDTAVLTQNAFTELRHTLSEGFTSYQLHSYRYNAASAAEFQPPKNPAWILRRTPWRPVKRKDHGPENPNINHLMVGYDTKNLQPKDRVALKIMRECWGVSCLDVNNGFGRLDIVLRDEEFGLLLIGTKRWLAETTRTFLQQSSGEQILVTRENKTVTIFAPKATAEAVLNAINDVLSKTQTAGFPISAITHKPLQLSKIQEVGRMTNTLTRLDAKNKFVVVSWVHAPGPAEEQEDLGSVVLRLLLNAYGPRSNAKSDTVVIPKWSSGRGRYVVNHHNKEKMSWTHRLTRWGRWVTPIAPKDNSTLPIPQISENHLVHPINALQHLPSPVSDPMDSTLRWSSPLTSTTATFGHVVHEQPEGRYMATIFNDSYERNFVPVIPPLSSLDLNQALVLPDRKNVILLARFLPSPLHQNQDLVRRAPPLELRIECNDSDNILRIVSLRAITGSHTRDIMMPTHPVDVRLEQKHYHEVAGSTISESNDPLSSVLHFLKNADLRPRDAKLRAPAHVDGLFLPRSLLAAKDGTNQDDRNESQDAGREDDLVKVDYLYTGIDLQRSVVGAWEGFSLVYTSIQAGRGGGRRAELALEAIPALADASIQPGQEGQMGQVRAPSAQDLRPEQFSNQTFQRAVNAILSDQRRFRWQGTNS